MKFKNLSLWKSLWITHPDCIFDTIVPLCKQRGRRGKIKTNKNER